MNIGEANDTVALLRHLDGSQLLDETDLAETCISLAERAGKTLQAAIRLDDDRLVAALAAAALVGHRDGCCGLDCEGCSPAAAGSAPAGATA